MCPYILSKRDPLPKAQPQQHKKGIQTQHKIMDLNVEFCDETHVIEVALADTVEDMRRKVASAVGLPEDSFDMSFGDKAMGEGADMTQLSAGDTIVLTKTKSKKQQAIAALRALGETDLRPDRVHKRKQDPELACLLLQAEVSPIIPCAFLEGTSITQLDLSAVSTVTHIESYFLQNCSSLTSVDLSSLRLEYIGQYFLLNCASLTALDLPSLNRLEYIGDDFLRNCASLTSLDLSSLKKVTHIGQRPFTKCRNLQTIHLSGCSAVVSRAVKKVNLSHLVVDASPKRKRDESPEEDCKRPRLSQ